MKDIGQVEDCLYLWAAADSPNTANAFDFNVQASVDDNGQRIVCLRSHRCESLSKSNDTDAHPRKSHSNICCSWCFKCCGDGKSLRKIVWYAYQLDKLALCEHRQMGTSDEVAAHVEEMRQRSYVTDKDFAVCTSDDIENTVLQDVQLSIEQVLVKNKIE